MKTKIEKIYYEYNIHRIDLAVQLSLSADRFKNGCKGMRFAVSGEKRCERTQITAAKEKRFIWNPQHHVRAYLKKLFPDGVHGRDPKAVTASVSENGMLHIA